MQSGEPSRTALAAAFHRAAHQVLEQGRIFTDPLALRILGSDAEAAIGQAKSEPDRRRMRIFIAIRTRLAEEALAAAVEPGLTERGVTQLVVLGAGLDTYAYRGAFRDRLRIFEVDHPATQEWKRQRLAATGIPIPDSLTFAPIDFERDTLPEALTAAGFDIAHQTFFMWLGVVPYLSRDAFLSTLTWIASQPGGGHVVFDYSDPPESFSPEMRAVHDRRAARVAELGEPWINYWEPEALRSTLLAMGFDEIEDLGPRDIAARYFPKTAVAMPAKGGHILRATRLRPDAGKTGRAAP